MLGTVPESAVWAIFYGYFFWSAFNWRPAVQGLVFSLIPAVLAGLVMVPQLGWMHPGAMRRPLMYAWIWAVVVPIRPGSVPVWTTDVRMPCARLAFANVLAAASVEGLVSMSPAVRSFTFPRIVDAEKITAARLRWAGPSVPSACDSRAGTTTTLLSLKGRHSPPLTRTAPEPAST